MLWSAVKFRPRQSTSDQSDRIVLALQELRVTNQRMLSSFTDTDLNRVPYENHHHQQHHHHQLSRYGTLKRGMHWHKKFLSHGALRVGEATTVDRFPLVVGRCGVPYLLTDQRGRGGRVQGEV